MALRFTEGFDYLPQGAQNASATALQALGCFSGASATQIVGPGRYGYGNYMIFPGEGYAEQYTGFAMPQNFSGMTYTGIAVFTGLNSNGRFGVFFMDSGFSAQVKIYFTLADQSILVVDGQDNTLAQSAPGVWSFSTWVYLEVGLKVAAAPNGTCIVLIDGKPVVTIQNTRTQTSANAQWNGLSVGSDWNFYGYQTSGCDDIYVCDDTGSVNNSFLGNCRIHALIPIGPGAVTAMTPSNGALANWKNASNALIDDTTYVSSATNGAADLYGLGTIPPSEPVYGVCLKGGYRQDDAGQRTAANQLAVSGVSYSGAARPLQQGGYSVSRDLWDLNPASGAGWTPAVINSAVQIGPKVVS